MGKGRMQRKGRERERDGVKGGRGRDRAKGSRFGEGRREGGREHCQYKSCSKLILSDPTHVPSSF